jgi:hypothetical protein
MPPEEAKRRRIEPWEREMAKAVPDKVVREIVSDNRHSVGGPSSIAASNKTTFPNEGERPEEGEPGTGWIKETPLRPPEGVEWCDRLVDVQDAIDRREREKKLKGE